MARRQMQIPGTERSDVPPALEEAGERWLDVRREKRRISDKAKEAKAHVLMLMQSHNVPVYRVKDPETEQIIELELDNEPKLRTKKTGEAESDVGEGVPDTAPSSPPAGPVKGLIAQALADQVDANVEESSDGDVVVPEKPAPKKPRKGRKSK